MPEDGQPCRDFQRGVCTRGDQCRFTHPVVEEASLAEDVKPPVKPICKDFQNNMCDRMKCKFMHLTQAEEAVFKNTGVLPEHGGCAEKIPRPPPGSVTSPPRRVASQDICKDFMNGKCDRGSRCRYVHETDPKILMRESYGKRSRVVGYDRPLYEENDMLRCKITELQKEVMSLRQMNDTLYDQNTKYRAQLHKGPPMGAPPFETVYPQQFPVVYPAVPGGAPPPGAGSPLSGYAARPF